VTAPTFWIVGGPNGSGKSTLCPSLFGGLPVLNPDVVAARLVAAGSSPAEAAVAAGREVVEQTRGALKGGKSFVIETTLSGRMQLRAASEARDRGWRVGLVFVCVASPALSMQRIASRVAAGGHDVPAADVERRFDRSLAHLVELSALADPLLAYDNSSREGHRLVLLRTGGATIYQADPPPVWLPPALLRS